MWIHDVKLEKYQALVPGGGPLRLGTSESQGNEQLRITLGDGWEGLTVRVIFRPCKITKMVPEDGMVDVPWEATRNPLTAAKGKIVFRGLSDDGRIINTLDLPYCVEGHSPTSGQEENQYTPGLVDQLVQQVKEDSQAARQAAKDADAAQEVAAKNADAAAKSSENAAASAQEAKETAAGIESQTKKYADAAAASAQEAKETAAGIESQTKKYADAAAASAQAAENSAAKAEAAADELGQIVKDGPVMSVNGQTGRVNLAAANLPFDNAGTPFVSTTVQDAIEELLMIGGGGSAVSMIRITAPAGAVVTIKNGAKVYTQTVGSDGADLSFMVLETGSWQVSGIWNDLQDSATVNVAEAGGTYSAVLDFAPFRAYIHVVARSGAVVTAAKGEQMVSDTVVGSDVTLTVSDKGQWTLSAVYDGGNAVPVVVDVQEEKATYEAELHFLVLTVTAPAGAEVTAAKDGDTIRKTAEAGTVDLYLTGPGLWTVSSAYDGAASQQVTVEVNAGQDTYTAEPAFATLEVTAPAGSSIKAQNGQTILTKTADTGSVLFYLPALGTWDLTAALNGQTATGSVDCSGYQQYSTELAFFSATIKTTAVDGATVKAVMGDYSVSGKAGTDGTATLTVLKPGSYTVSASYSGASSNSKSVDVSESGQQYTVSVEFVTLTVTAPEGSTITVKNNVTELTDTGGTVKFYLPNTGTWAVTAELSGRTASDSVECYAYQAYSTSLSYFSATIKVTAVQGATVKAVLDGYTVSGEAGSGGVVTLTVLQPGSYTVSATYKNALSNSKAVQVSQSGQEYPVSVAFITLTVTAPEGSTITAKNGATTLTDTGGTVKFYLPNTGIWTITAELDGQTASSAVEASDYKDYPVTLAYVHIYGASWDGTSTTKWTRTDDSAGFVDPVPYVQGVSSYSSPFDNLQPWAGMAKSERTGGTMVAIPKFWYELKQNGNGMTIRIATGPIEGFSVSPAHMDRGDGKGERDVVYIGRYHCGTSSNKSTSGQRPKANITRSSARSTIHGLGANIWQMDFLMRFTIWLLYIVEFADWNSQAKIGYGCGNNSSTENMGYTDSMPYHTGTTKNSRTTYGCGTQYRNIEGLWDNVLDWMDGCYYNGSGLNVIKNPNQFSDSANGVNVGTLTSGYPSKFTVRSQAGFPLFAPSASSGSDSTYSCDYWYFNSSYPCLYVGGDYYQDTYCGLFCVDCNNASDSGASIGCRLQELP